jgi:hypothetical protein
MCGRLLVIRSLLPLLLALTLACEPPPENNLAVDNDGDGFSEFEGDCDDADAGQGLQPEDEDCDGVLTEDDCDGGEDTLLRVGDCDGDGTVTKEDCDDTDPTSMVMAEDGDCDGVLTADDGGASVGICWLTVSAGGYHTCGVASTGSVECWGRDNYGQSTPPEL